ncbi:hypothetical protein KUV50_10750 [Membranicola marinus]|uniref:Outer membrane protein beta-barrel domain-containing protein n=1 Tax=Membranihabitans marinus TaxID=1227546 RepID=A0A953HMC2_9BACT|nr:hypothetical protein [Membranihabitans marinus]MBY5958614.1 hypothetical protein [Membranihabitans marinus]
MKNAIILALTLFTLTSYAQNPGQAVERKGFVIGIGAGIGVVSISHGDHGSFEKAEGGLSLPDLRLGWMINERLAIIGNSPGKIYDYEGKDRHFGAIIPTVQYWIQDRLWINGGFGLAMDSPALYDIDDLEDEEWNFGCAVTASAGYELVQKKNYALDLHTQVLLGRVNTGNDQHRDGVVISVGVGFTWY